MTSKKVTGIINWLKNWFYDKTEINNSEPEYVVGTHGTSTTATWTGTCSKLTEIKDGTTIFFYLTSAGTTNVTLNLTLANGTQTGAKNVYFKGTTRLSTQYPINSIVTLVYTTKRDSGAWYVSSANDNNGYNAYEYGTVQFTAGEQLASRVICGAKADGKYYKLVSGLELSTAYPLIGTNGAISKDTVSNNMYNPRYDETIANTKSGLTLTNGKPVYVEGTNYVNGIFTVSSNILTQTLTNGRYYWLLGFAYGNTNVRTNVYEEIFYYDGVNLRPIIHDTDIDWNGTNTQNSVSPLDMAMYEEFSPNRLAYFPSNNITIEYSTDGGSTWSDYGASASQKVSLVTLSQSFINGKNSTTNYANNKLRITIDAGEITSTVGAKIYLITRKLMIYMCTCNASNPKVLVEKAFYPSNTDFSTVGTYDLSGWSGWNSIPLNITFGGYANQGSSGQVQKLRLTFTCTGGTGNLNVSKLRLFGETCYTFPSHLSRIGHMYTYDVDQNVTFPAKIIKSGGTSNQFLKADGSVDSNTYLTTTDASNTYQAKGSYATASHGHGKVTSGGTLSETTTSVKNVVVTDTTNNNLRVINKVPFANLDIDKEDIVGLGIPSSDTNTTYSADESTLTKSSSNVFSLKDSSSYVKTSDSRLSDTRNPKSNNIVASSTDIKDLNDYKTTGFYFNGNNTQAQYIIHCPNSNGTATPYTGNKAFFLLVEDWGSSNYTKQTLTYYDTNKTYTRIRNGGTWGNWYEISANTNYYDRMYSTAQIVGGEALTKNAIVVGKTDYKYYNLKSGQVFNVRYPILWTNVAVASGGNTNNAYLIYNGVNLQTTVSGKTVTNQRQVYIEGTAYNNGDFTTSSNVFVSDGSFTSGRYYIPIGIAYSTTNVRFDTSNSKVFYYNGTNLLPVEDSKYVKKETDNALFPDTAYKINQETPFTMFTGQGQYTNLYEFLNYIYSTAGTLSSTYAPKYHASNVSGTADLYGKASTSNWGHVKLDSSPTNGSSNAVTSDAIYDALSDKADVEHSHNATGINFTPSSDWGDSQGITNVKLGLDYLRVDVNNKANSSHNHDTWTKYTLTNGALYVNTAIRMCELHYTQGGVTYSANANTWMTVETISKITEYPPLTTIYATDSAQNAKIRLQANGKLDVIYSTKNGVISVTGNFMWHY